MAHDGQCDVETRARMERMLSLLRPSRGRCASVNQPSQPARLVSAWAGGRGRAIAARVMRCTDATTAAVPCLLDLIFTYSHSTILSHLCCAIATRYHVVAPAIATSHSAARSLHTRPALTLPPEATPTPRRATTLPILLAFACTTAPEFNGIAPVIAPRRLLPTNNLRPWFS